MGKSNWQIIRLSLLAVTFGGSFLVLVKAVFFSNPAEETGMNYFDFPAKVPLQGWEQIKSTPLKENIKNEELAVYNGKEYQYIQDDNKLDIQARFEKYSDSNVGRLLVVYTPLEPATVQLKLNYAEEVGYYAVFVYDNTIHISACINPKGKTTATEEQFVKNKYTYGLSVKRTILWILGQQDLVDSSCLWTLLSMPVPQASSTAMEEADIAATYQKLETAWFDWYNWWESRFPPKS